ncbi:radical SAM family heme chaperone HemW [Fulvivirgaceae bacterium PWU4]|uniref:Heme chaperone HemW n=1 Tax=Chryseosolibacter histidini TaxID=2782349 RepID=A0AAP2GRQ0_9BACT|nr:radical SAM family heme chaperone HemW [Chryseosolibacter histidini]MBT1699832.1 radical SAM family heme chaperone HemW [Chryseosolibacter histidini]
MAGIYIHIPFCKQACHYCDFHFSTSTAIRQELLNAMSDELLLQRHYLYGEKVETIYFGGGTPSLLGADELNLLLKPVNTLFTVAPDAEVTLEANPDDLTPSRLAELRQLGINRLSIGIQSFQDSVLKFLNRAHDATAAMQCVGQARQAGFQNISIDLIYAIPGQADEAWQANIDAALKLAPEHISSYSLTIEEKTAFGRWAAQGKLKAADDDLAAKQLEMLVATLEREGYEQYEVSNFSKPGYQSRHNSSYWKQQRYLGIGPSAHSYDKVSRQYNVSNNHQYVRSMKEGRIPFEREVLSTEDHVNEYLLTTLRTQWGSDLEKLKQEYGYDVLGQHGGLINDLLARKLAVVERNFLKLTRTGRLLADKISSDLFLIS